MKRNRTREKDSFEVRGIPLAMQQDGWWLSGAGEEPQKQVRLGEGPWVRTTLLAGLIALADALLWQVVAGVSLAIFGVALVAGAVLVIEPQMERRRLAICSMMALLSVLPLVEMVQPLSIIILSVGIALTLCVVAGLRGDRLVVGAVRLFWVGPAQTLADGWNCAVKGGSVQVHKGQLRRVMLGWGLPVVLTAVFALLFAEANPVLDQWLGDLIPTTVPVPNLERWAFWLLMALLSWPCLILLRLKERLGATRHTVKMGRSIDIINPQSIMRSLIMFNILFAVQTGMDVFFLYGGGDLPEGMSFAKYAHRGAYPLVLTALLAGIFALASKPFAAQAPVLRVLLLFWVAQNLALVVGSLVRLELYIDTYGLTHWRISALIWMGLVAAGLCVTWLQIQQDHSNRWMMLRVGFLMCVTLYVCAFFSFDRAIAHYNLTHDVRIDKWYVCNLGEAAMPEIQKLTGKSAGQYCDSYSYLAQTDAFVPKDWREWGFRNWRVRRSLEAMTEAAILP
jgi:hypothetical protein